MQNDGDVSSGSAGAEAGSHGSHTEKQYPIPFPDMGHIGGYPPRGSRARLMHPDDETIPVTLSDDSVLPTSMPPAAEATSFYAEAMFEPSSPLAEPYTPLHAHGQLAEASDPLVA